MEEYDSAHIVKKPAIGIYVRKGATPGPRGQGRLLLTDLRSGSLPPSVIEGVKADGHASSGYGLTRSRPDQSE